MNDRCVVKWGGGLITAKSAGVVRAPNLAVIASLAQTVAALHKRGVQVLLVHGAGSYGHLRARRWRLAEGALDPVEFAGLVRSANAEWCCATQGDAVDQVRVEMLELSAHVCRALTAVGLQPQPHPPHQWAHNTGVAFRGDLARFDVREPGVVPVTWGDVVDVDGAQSFGILSGDDIVVRLALEVPRVARLVFCVGGVDGLLAVPPHRATAADLIPRWDANDFSAFTGAHDASIDVTGGIGVKAARGAHVVVASRGAVRVVLVNGEEPHRIVAACAGDAGVRCTEIVLPKPVELRVAAALVLAPLVLFGRQRRSAAALCGVAAAGVAAIAALRYARWRSSERDAAKARAGALACDGFCVVPGASAVEKRRAWRAGGYAAKLLARWREVVPALDLAERATWPVVPGGFAQAYRYCQPAGRTDRDSELELPLRLCSDNAALQAAMIAFLDPDLSGAFHFADRRTHWRVRLLCGGGGALGAVRGALWACGIVAPAAWLGGAANTLALHGQDNSWGLVLWPDAAQGTGLAIPSGAHIDGAWCYGKGVPLGGVAAASGAAASEADRLSVEERLAITHAHQIAFQLSIVTPATHATGEEEGMTAVWPGSHTLAAEVVRRAAERGERVDWIALRRSLRAMAHARNEQRSASALFVTPPPAACCGARALSRRPRWQAKLHQPTLAHDEVAIFAGFALHTTTYASRAMQVDGVARPRVAMNPAVHLDDLGAPGLAARAQRLARLLPAHAPARAAWRIEPCAMDGVAMADARWSDADADELERRIGEYAAVENVEGCEKKKEAFLK